MKKHEKESTNKVDHKGNASATLVSLIKEAQKKTGESKPLRLSRFIPEEEGSEFALHHLSFSSLLSRHPERAMKDIRRYILDPKDPVLLQSSILKNRNYSSRKNVVRMQRDDIQEIIKTLYDHKEWEVLNKIQGNLYSDRQLQSMLKKSINNWEMREDLWKAYIERSKKR